MFAHDIIKGKYDIAVRENEFIYHEKVPSELDELKGELKMIFFRENDFISYFDEIFESLTIHLVCYLHSQFF